MLSTRNWKKLAIRGGGGFVVLALLLTLLVDVDNPPDILLFVGRFHPMVVHFPIGFLVIGGLLEVVSRFVPEVRVPDSTILLVLGLGAVSAIGAVVAGFFLSLSGGYNEDLIGWHKWLGIVVAVGGLAAVGLKLYSAREVHSSWSHAYRGVLIGTVAVLLITGHLGGTLTHGSGYLTRYLPEPIKQLTGLGAGMMGSRTIAHVDSAVVYTDLVQPILNDRCVECHGQSKTEGELRLDTPEQLMKGGEDGEVITPGNPEQSELVERITLPLYHDDRMPPEGEEPLSIEQTELIRWWVATGASFDTTVAELRADAVPTSVQTVLTRLSRPRSERKTGLYALEVEPADSGAIERLRGEGFDIQRIADDAPFLEVRLQESGDAVDQKQLARLEPIAPQVAWLDLAGTDLAQGALRSVGVFEHLTRLHLERSSVADETLQHIDGLEHLEYLNLYGTSITDAGLQQLGELKDLKKVFLWQTNVTPEGIEQFQQQRRGVRINRGAAMAVVDSTDVASDSTEIE